jgi:cysteine desulfurase
MLTAALGAACELAGDLTAMTTLRRLRDQFWDALRAGLGDRVALNGHPEQRLPNTLNVSFVGCNGAEILAALGGVAASTGSACHSGQVEVSPVLRAMNISNDVAVGAVRFSLGRATTADEVAEVIERISACMAIRQR